jgi:hypothetical protein
MPENGGWRLGKESVTVNHKVREVLAANVALQPIGFFIF